MWQVCLLVIVFGCEPGKPQQPAPNEPAQSMPFGMLPASSSGLDELIDTLNAAGADLRRIGEPNHSKALLVNLPSDAYTPAVLHQPGGISAEQALNAAGVAVVVGSGFATNPRSLTPVGLLIVNGDRVSEVQPHGYTRLLNISNNTIQVDHRSTSQAERIDHALQLGPGIVEEGRLDISERDLKRPRYFRSFVAVCATRWVVGISLEPVNLHSLGKSLVEHFDQQGMRCTDVVNMAGNHQAILAMKTADGIFYHGEVSTPKVSLLGFSAR